MRFSATLAVLAVAQLASAAVDWSCIKTQPEYTALLPECAKHCHTLGLTTNGCDPNDFICHCRSFWRTASIIEPCSDDPAQYTCTQEQTLAFVGIARDFCTFWNATSKAAEEAVKASCSKTGSCGTTKKLTFSVPNSNVKADCPAGGKCHKKRTVNM